MFFTELVQTEQQYIVEIVLKVSFNTLIFELLANSRTAQYQFRKLSNPQKRTNQVRVLVLVVTYCCKRTTRKKKKKKKCYKTDKATDDLATDDLAGNSIPGADKYS